MKLRENERMNLLRCQELPTPADAWLHPKTRMQILWWKGQANVTHYQRKGIGNFIEKNVLGML